MTEQANAVTAAEKVVADLEQKRRALIERGQELAGTRHRLSYDAAVEANPKAVKALATLALDAADVGREMETLVSAIGEAERRLAIAQAAQVRQADCASALELKKLIEDLDEHFTVADDALVDLVSATNNLKVGFDRLFQMGVSNPRQEQLAVMLNLSILTSLGETPPLIRRYFQTLAPRERKNLVAVWASWRTSLMADVQRRLGEDEQQTTESADAA
jgi:hypothetical protein